MSSLVGLSSATLADQAYDALRAAIVAGELPRGERITERGLAERLQVSPTPVREALRRLEQDRLVERDGPRTIRVAELADADRADVSAIEDTLRGLAARLAAAKATPAQLAAMKVELDAADAVQAELDAVAAPDPGAVRAAVEQMFRHVREFHRLLDESSNSVVLRHLLKTVEAFDARERRRQVQQTIDRGDTDAIRARYPEHRQILEALEARDEDGAEQLVLAHCRSATPDRLLASQ
jgi:DNA-binding GntR family transcriptional regulator